MYTLDFIVQRHLELSTNLATDAHFLHVVGRPSRPRVGVLRVYDCPGDVLSIGRYHLAPSAASPSTTTQLFRRRSGGRAIPFGEGFVGVALVLPHRAALFSP